MLIKEQSFISPKYILVNLGIVQLFVLMGRMSFTFLYSVVEHLSGLSTDHRRQYDCCVDYLQDPCAVVKVGNSTHA